MAKGKDRSILDTMTVKEDGFPLRKGESLREEPICEEEIGELLEMVSVCPVCGSPIYGRNRTRQLSPSVRYSCSCRFKVSSLTGQK